MHKKKTTYSGYIDDCSPHQLEMLDKFRARARDMGSLEPQYDDVYLLRFLRARKFDLEKTTEMWKNYINWRKEKKVDEVAKYDFPELNEAKQHYPHAWFRTDKEGRPIFIERPGKVHLDKLNKVMSNERLYQHFVHDYERLMNVIFPACSQAKGELVTKSVYIMDLKGVSAKMMSPKIWELLKIAAKLGQDNYPEILGTMYIVNTPLFFHGCWAILKNFVDEKTRKKVHILGSSFKKELLQVVDENDLPDFLGGKLTEADYGANLTNEQGPWMKAAKCSSALTRVSEDKEGQMYNSTEHRNSTATDMKDDSETDGCTPSLPSLAKPCYIIEELVEGEFQEVADELAVRHAIKTFQPNSSYISIN